jgi:hypothetical protein
VVQLDNSSGTVCHRSIALHDVRHSARSFSSSSESGDLLGGVFTLNSGQATTAGWLAGMIGDWRFCRSATSEGTFRSFPPLPRSRRHDMTGSRKPCRRCLSVCLHFPAAPQTGRKRERKFALQASPPKKVLTGWAGWLTCIRTCGPATLNKRTE